MKDTIYKTRDLYEASFHYAISSKAFIGLEQDGRDFLFVFDDPQSKQNSDAYYTRQATVVAKDLTDSIRTMKDYLFNELRAQRQAELFMMLSRELIEEFRTIVYEEYHRNLTYEEAQSIAQGIVEYYGTLAHINQRLNVKKKRDERYYKKVP